MRPGRARSGTIPVTVSGSLSNRLGAPCRTPHATGALATRRLDYSGAGSGWSNLGNREWSQKDTLRALTNDASRLAGPAGDPFSARKSRPVVLRRRGGSPVGRSERDHEVVGVQGREGHVLQRDRVAGAHRDHSVG